MPSGIANVDILPFSLNSSRVTVSKMTPWLAGALAEYFQRLATETAAPTADLTPSPAEALDPSRVSSQRGWSRH